MFTLNGAGVHAKFDNCDFQNNGFSDIYGQLVGGVVQATGATVAFEQCVFRRNRAARGATIYAQGGAKLTSTGSEFTDNLALYGGSLVVSANVEATLNDCSMEHNQALYGGVVFYFGAGSVEFNNCNMESNLALESGGVAYMSTTTGAAVRFTECVIQNNKANVLGSVVYAASDAVCIFDNSVVSDNLSGDGGSAVYGTDSAEIVVVQSTFAGNHAQEHTTNENSPVTALSLSHSQGTVKMNAVPSKHEPLQQHASTSVAGDHIFLDSGSAQIVACFGNSFQDPEGSIGVVYSDGQRACG